jgi:hypothetical protein
MILDKFRVSRMAHLTLNEYVLCFPRCPEDERYPSFEDQPNGFMFGGRSNFYRIRKAGRNGSIGTSIVYKDPAGSGRYIFYCNFSIPADGRLYEAPYVGCTEIDLIYRRAVEKYLKTPGVTKVNMPRSYTRVQSTMLSPSYRRVAQP